ncbi:MAG: hypothetical protein J6D08_01685 [Lachnospiraceae bacterium]|nr:hypothetical protein [Lachnospiraceae bacterium]
MNKMNKKKVSAAVVLALTAIGVGNFVIKKAAAHKKLKKIEDLQINGDEMNPADDNDERADETRAEKRRFDITEFTDSQKAYDILCKMVNEKNCYIVVSDVAKDTESEEAQNGAVIAKELYFMNEENKYLGEIKLESELDKFNDLSQGHTVIAYAGTYIDKTKNLDGKWIQNARSAIENTGYIINIETIGRSGHPVIDTIEKRENIEGNLVIKEIYNAAEEKDKTPVIPVRQRAEKQNSDENQDKKAVSQNPGAADAKTDKITDAKSEGKETIKNTGYKDILDCSFF